MTNITTSYRPDTPTEAVLLPQSSRRWRQRPAGVVGAVVLAGLAAATLTVVSSDETAPGSAVTTTVPAPVASTDTGRAASAAAALASDASSRQYARMSPDAVERWTSATPVAGRPFLSADAAERWAEARAGGPAARQHLSADAAERWAEDR